MWLFALLASRLHWLPALTLAWSGLSLALVCGLYVGAALGASPGGLLRGSRCGWLQPALWPFRAVSLGVHLLSRVSGHLEPVCEVSPGVFVGGRPRGVELDFLTERGVLSVIDMAAELPVQRAFLSEPFARYDLSVLDRTAPGDEALDRAVAWAKAELARGRCVLVHCSFGRGRSALVACALAMATAETIETVDEVIARVRARRIGVRIKSDQRAALKRFAERQRTVRKP